MKLAIREFADLARLAFPDQRELVAARGEMTIEAVVRRVDLSADEPFRVRRIPFENAIPFALPIELLGPSGPESFAIALRLLPDVFILDVRLFAKFCGRFELASFFQQRVDLVCGHGILRGEDSNIVTR